MKIQVCTADGGDAVASPYPSPAATRARCTVISVRRWKTAVNIATQKKLTAVTTAPVAVVDSATVHVIAAVAVASSPWTWAVVTRCRRHRSTAAIANPTAASTPARRRGAVSLKGTTTVTAQIAAMRPMAVVRTVT
ncbi:hypothetical protein [Cellulomonas sp. ATA003]|uniref:hypothetical protein n=1 Tax=Cellulomonas sp. ATA003 TaxID=3073064 RepID=UPI0028737AEF|nr:hypothetical protein [Cellulomonas sp. ATA003]WNB84271.1 hypothetical protein REH70_10175 [Cellulomonas sp. ATA003]